MSSSSHRKHSRTASERGLRQRLVFEVCDTACRAIYIIGVYLPSFLSLIYKSLCVLRRHFSFHLSHVLLLCRLLPFILKAFFCSTTTKIDDTRVSIDISLHSSVSLQ